MNAPSKRRRLGRRRRRLYLTIGLLVAAVLVGGGYGVWSYRASRPETYRGAGELDDITRRLDLDLPQEAPEPSFVDVTREAGLELYRAFAGDRTSQLPEDMGPGAAWGDYDGDGDDDLFLVSAGGPIEAPADQRAPSLLFENRGDGRFDVVESFPATHILGMGAAWADYDGDGDLDLAVSGFGALRLFRNEAGRFEPDPSIGDRPGFWAGITWADFDRDGDLDLYVCGYVRYEVDEREREMATMQYGRSVPFTLNPASFQPERNLLFVNDGDGGFEERAEALGVSNPEGRSLVALWHDVDDNGWPDLYVANDISDNLLLLNRGGRFEDASHTAWVADYRGAMGLTAGDWNRDGDDDLFVTHWIAQENALYDSLRRDLHAPSGDGEAEEQVLRFMDVADQRGLGQVALQRIGWGTEFADLDGDGWLDLVVANGSTFETEEAPPRLKSQPPFLFWNQRGEHFFDLAPLHDELARPRVGRGLALSDYDLDGDLDLLLVDRGDGVRLFRNDMQSGHWVQLRLRDDSGGPAGAVGARVVARVGDAVLRRSPGGVSYLSQSTSTLHLGLGSATVVDALEILWPDGRRDRLEALAAGARWDIRPGTPPRRVEPPPARGEALDRAATRRFWKIQRSAMHAVKVDADFDAAIPLFEEALSLDPDHGDSLYYLANCLAETGDVAGALARLAHLMRTDPMSHRAHKRWGVLRASTAASPADLDAAERALERAFAINGEETGVLHVLGEVALIRGDLDGAARRFGLEVRTNPQSIAGRVLLAYTDWKRGDVDLAAERLEEALVSGDEPWRPSGAAAEGDVRQTMHDEASPLSPWTDAWDGSTTPERAFAALDRHLSELSGLTTDGAQNL